MSTDYKTKYLKYKKKYLDLKSNIDQTSGSNKDKDLILSGTFQIGEFKKNMQLFGGDSDSYEEYFGELFKKEKNGKAVNYEIYFRENDLKGNLKRDRKEMKLHIKFSNEGDMLDKKIYVIEKFYYQMRFEPWSYKLLLNYPYIKRFGGKDSYQQYPSVALLDWTNVKKKNMVNHLKNGGAISQDVLFSPNTIYKANATGKTYNGFYATPLSKEELEKENKDYKMGIIDIIGIPEGWEVKYDNNAKRGFTVYHEYQNDGIRVYDIVEHLEAKASKR